MLLEANPSAMHMYACVRCHMAVLQQHVMTRTATSLTYSLSWCDLQVYRPLEFLFTIAAFTTLAENFLPQLIALPKASYILAPAQSVQHMPQNLPKICSLFAFN